MANLVSRGGRGGTPAGLSAVCVAPTTPKAAQVHRLDQPGVSERAPDHPGLERQLGVPLVLQAPLRPRPAPPTYASSGPPPRPSLASSPLCARLLTCPNLPAGSACSLATRLAAGPGPRGGMVLGLKKQHKPTVHAAEGAGRLAPRGGGGVLGGSGARTQHGQTGKNKTKTEPKPTTTTTTGRLQK